MADERHALISCLAMQHRN